MFEAVYKTALAEFNANSQIIDSCWMEIGFAYSAPGRFYHTLQHLDQIISELVEAKPLIRDWSSAVFATAYHDFIYEPSGNASEKKSAEAAAVRLKQVNCLPVIIEKCRQQILATKKHQPSDDDTNYFTDADLSILGTDEATYLNYSEQIRK